MSVHKSKTRTFSKLVLCKRCISSQTPSYTSRGKKRPLYVEKVVLWLENPRLERN